MVMATEMTMPGRVRLSQLMTCIMIVLCCLRFNCGTGIAVITSENRIKLGSWHSVTVFRNGLDGWLRLDNYPPVSGKSQVSFSPPLIKGDTSINIFFYPEAGWDSGASLDSKTSTLGVLGGMVYIWGCRNNGLMACDAPGVIYRVPCSLFTLASL